MFGRLKLAWRIYKAYMQFVKETKGEMTLVDWIKGVIILSVLGVGVGLPIVIKTIQSVNITDPTTSLVVNFIPAIVAVALLLGYLGR
ncbi:hypothetical protein Ferp_2039 [Ferroglobus placidus DSM 10642]|uniref:Uncharacterized protein n=1 Tax=Ferroglobus placidus (strain DSM 10642 / AEDII12DO) TaxID=589924 RepID=D3S0B1_FERPA|nr:hypothetical protein [Ferroglobus placidus]ADC66174.1 hypothetical protein Ferp_2039 [Ferroglobus placidus DSM 10642]